MRILSATTHGIIDYIFVILLALSPSLFHMDGDLATFTYGLACIHLLLTILTDFKPGLVKLIPFRVHGLIEVVVALALAGVAFYFYKQGSTLGFYYYMALTVTILLVFGLTDFKGNAGKA